MGREFRRKLRSVEMGEQLSCPCHSEQEMISEQHMDIYLAVREGNLAEARLIISSYPMKVNARDEEMKTPLHKAANKNNVEMAQLLLAAGADVNAKNKDGNTPLNYAANKKHCEMVDCLLSAGADPSADNRYGYTPLHYAKTEGGRT